MPIPCPLEMSGWRSEPTEGSRRELSTDTSMAFKTTGLGRDLCRQTVGAAKARGESSGAPGAQQSRRSGESIKKQGEPDMSPKTRKVLKKRKDTDFLSKRFRGQMSCRQRSGQWA